MTTTTNEQQQQQNDQQQQQQHWPSNQKFSSKDRMFNLETKRKLLKNSRFINRNNPMSQLNNDETENL